MGAQLHGGAERTWAKLTPPLLAMRVLWRRHTMIQDVHSNKWWNITASRILKMLQPDDLERYPISPRRRCTAVSFLAELPVAEALLATLIAALLWKVLVQGAA